VQYNADSVVSIVQPEAQWVNIALYHALFNAHAQLKEHVSLVSAIDHWHIPADMEVTKAL
jgi:hypothetical protein